MPKRHHSSVQDEDVAVAGFSTPAEQHNQSRYRISIHPEQGPLYVGMFTD